MVERYRPRNIMRRFVITEVSAVDKPAQAPARAAIVKRELTPEQRAAASQPRHRDEETEKLLKLQHAALTYAESEYMMKLEGDARRAFVLADHAARRSIIAAGDQPQPEDEETEMPTFKTFEDAAAHYAKSGMSGTTAMQTARSAHPDLFAKLQAQPAEIAKAAAAEADTIRKNRERQNRVQALVKAEVAVSKCRPTAAIRKVRDAHPELFAAA